MPSPHIACAILLPAHPEAPSEFASLKPSEHAFAT
jgi:hypothetical protein